MYCAVECVSYTTVALIMFVCIDLGVMHQILFSTKMHYVNQLFLSGGSNESLQHISEIEYLLSRGPIASVVNGLTSFTLNKYLTFSFINETLVSKLLKGGEV